MVIDGRNQAIIFIIRSTLMVIDGRRDNRESFKLAKFEGDRILVPSRLVELADRSPLAGKTPIDCWLLVVKPGRYRLVRHEDVERLLKQIEDSQARREVLEGVEDDSGDSVSARLIPCTASPPGPGWRVYVPKEARSLVVGEKTFVYLLVRAGYLELWFPDVLRAALSESLSDVVGPS
jgi:hypothetical protein